MKLGIFCNYSWPHVGGSEYVLKSISDLLVREYNYKVNVYSCNLKHPFIDSGVGYFPCERGPKIFHQASENDHILIYSDSFWEFDSLMGGIDKIDCRASVALVGAYHLRNKACPGILKIIKKNIGKVGFITHSSITQDYKWAIFHKLPVSVVPNGVDLEEFRNNNVNFREKYGIKNKYIFLNVGNYFFGKGQEILPDIYDAISGNLNDFVFISISNSIKYLHEKIFLDKCIKMSHGGNIKFLRDIPREDVVAAFKSSNVFVFTSRKEVAPLVINECRASKLPYVSMNVGNIEEQSGGIPIIYNREDANGYAIADPKVVRHYYLCILKLIQMDSLRETVISEGQKNIESIDWKNIVPLYHKVFSS